MYKRIGVGRAILPKHVQIETKMGYDLFIYSNGDVALCCADDNGYFKLGNVIDRDPIEIFNNEVFTNYRTKMATGNIMQLEHCKTCSMPRSRFFKTKD